MNTRIRAIILASIATAVFVLTLSGIVDPRAALDRVNITSTVFANFIIAGLVSLVLAVGLPWVLFFKRRGMSPFTIGLLPAVIAFPLVLLLDSVIVPALSDFTQFSIIVIVGAVFWVATYLLILTANVLNGSVLYNIPLGQAGKAAQFIFSLISTYFLIAYLFGAAFPIEVRVILIATFVFYFTYSAIWVLRVPLRQAFVSAGAITAMMVLVIILLSVWPISSVYATLAAIVFFYIMLNVALEMREIIGRMVWVEYVLLVSVVLLILFTNSSWGINGSLL
jgi:hypothetical protein